MKALFFSLLVFLSLASPSFSLSPNLQFVSGEWCVYTVMVRTGADKTAGTGSMIGMTLGGADGKNFTVRDLVKWGGMMGEGHKYFQPGNVDVFRGGERCINGQPCYMRARSDTSGENHPWYLESVEAFRTFGATKPNGCARQRFTVGQWLAKDPAYPGSKIDAIRDYCVRGGNGPRHEEELSMVV